MSNTPAPTDPADRQTPPPGRRKHLLPLLGAETLALLLVAALSITWHTFGSVDHITVRALEEHELPQTAAEQAWEWHPPEGSKASAFHPIPSGLVARLDDGAIALDGTTGEQTWHYQHNNFRLRSLATTPEQDHTVLTFEIPEEDIREDGFWQEADPELQKLDAPRLLVVLDTATGEVVNEQTVEAAEEPKRHSNPVHGPESSVFSLSTAEAHHITQDARLASFGGSSSVEARSLTDDSVLWSHTDAFHSMEGSKDWTSARYGQGLVSGTTAVFGLFGATDEHPRYYEYRITAVDTETGRTRWKHSWPIGDITRERDPSTFLSPGIQSLSGMGTTPDPTFTLGENSVALRLYPEEQGRLLDLETGQELVSDLWPESGGLLALTEDGYITLGSDDHDRGNRNRGVHYFDRHGEHRHTVESDLLVQGPAQTMALTTDEALIALRVDPDDPAPYAPEDWALTTDLWQTGERAGQVPVDISPGRYEQMNASYEFAAEPSPYLQQVPGAIALMDPVTNRILGFTP